MRSPFRVLAGVIGGLLAGFAIIIIVVVEALGSKVHPFPQGLDAGDMEAPEAHVAQLPRGAFLLVLSGRGPASFFGSWPATRIGLARHSPPGLIVGAVLLVAGIANVLILRPPTRFRVAALIVLRPLTYSGTRFGVSRSRAALADRG